MDPEPPCPAADRAEVDRHLDAAMELSRDERARYLAGLAEKNPALADDVATLLRLADRDDPRLDPRGLTDGPLWHSLAAEMSDDVQSLVAGDTIGAYRILREIGRGGTAVVYLAERADGLFDQRVAVKIMWAHGAVNSHERFEQERQILAALDHPSIARLLDAGFDDRGFSFIVLEYVEGRPITRYCDEDKLGLDDRLAIFAHVCAAVLSAHRSLVVHRDLKPSNILVNEQGGVKLLDFGIAKLLDAAVAGSHAAPPTRAFVRVLTPDYSSPEQVRGGAITTATDVYQLGLILYELLAGRRAQSVSEMDLIEVERTVCLRDPEKPSVAAAHGARKVPADLDAIVMKALRKEPGDRYQSPAQLVEDLERYRTGRPVLARSGTTVYRARKFVARHRLGLAVVSVMITITTVYIVMITVQSRRVVEEAARTEQVKAFLIGLFDASNPGNSLGDLTTARELLDRGRERVDLELAGQPEIQAEMLTVLGKIYNTIGLYTEAVPLLERARQLRVQDASGSVRLAETTFWLAVNLHYAGQYAAAELRFRETLELRRKLRPPDHWEIASTLDAFGFLLRSVGRLGEAESMLRDAIDIELSRPGAWPVGRAAPLRNLGDVLTERGAWDEAERCYRESIRLVRERGTPIDPLLAASQDALGRLLTLKGDLDEAESVLDQTLAMRQRLYGGSHATVGLTMLNLGALRVKQGRPREAAPLFEQARQMLLRFFGDEHSLVARVLIEQAAADLAVSSATTALARLDEAQARLRQVGFDRHPIMAHALVWRARSLRDAGRVDDARAAYRLALALRESISVASDPRVAELRIELSALQP